MQGVMMVENALRLSWKAVKTISLEMMMENGLMMQCNIKIWFAISKEEMFTDQLLFSPIE
jgi:hypothetical protein